MKLLGAIKSLNINYVEIVFKYSELSSFYNLEGKEY